MEKDLTLIIDIGNTTIVAGLFDKNGVIVERYISKTQNPSYYNLNKIEIKDKNIASRIGGGLICSVVPSINTFIQKMIFDAFSIHVDIMDFSMVKHLKLNVDNPNEVGGDIIAASVGGIEKYNGPVGIVDLGTVTKAIAINKNNEIDGVSFIPGIQNNFDSFAKIAAMIPTYDDFKNFDKKETPKSVIGKNTKECIESGIYFSNVAIIEKFADFMIKTYGKTTRTIVTGGFSNYIKNGVNHQNIIFDYDLVLNGVYKIYKEGN